MGFVYNQVDVCFLESPKRPMVSMLIAPAVTPWRWVGPKGPALARNPALRAVSYEASQPHKLKEYVQFFLRLDKANDPNNKETVEWQNEYHFTRHYTGVSDLTPQVRIVNLVSSNMVGQPLVSKFFFSRLSEVVSLIVKGQSINHHIQSLGLTKKILVCPLC